jgi:holo-[acyl-carrier protein] synthase
VAGRFAAKEAAMKALGTGWRGLAFREIEIDREPSGKPLIRFHGRARERARQLGVFAAEVSITHTDSIAAAVVVLLANGRTANGERRT